MKNEQDDLTDLRVRDVYLAGLLIAQGHALRRIEPDPIAKRHDGLPLSVFCFDRKAGPLVSAYLAGTAIAPIRPVFDAVKWLKRRIVQR